MAVVNENERRQERQAPEASGVAVDVAEDVVSRVRQNRLQEEAVEESKAESFMDRMSGRAGSNLTPEAMQDAMTGTQGPVADSQYSDLYDPEQEEMQDVHDSADERGGGDRYYINTDPDTKGEIYTSEDIDAMREVLARDDAMAGNGSYEDSLNALQDGSYAEKDTEDLTVPGEGDEAGGNHGMPGRDMEHDLRQDSYEAESGAADGKAADEEAGETGAAGQKDGQDTVTYDSVYHEERKKYADMTDEKEAESADVGRKLDDNETVLSGTAENQLDMSNSTVTDENGNTYVRQYTDEEKAHMREVVAAADSIDGKGSYESNLEALQDGSFAKTEPESPQEGHEGPEGPGHHGPMPPHLREMDNEAGLSSQFSMEEDMSMYANAETEEEYQASVKEHSGMKGMGGRPPMEFDSSLNDVSDMFRKENMYEEAEDLSASEEKRSGLSKGKAPQRSHEETMDKAEKALGRIVDRVEGNEDAFEDEDDSQFGA